LHLLQPFSNFNTFFIHRAVLICCCRYFDFAKLAEITQQVTKNLNKIIDINYYPVETARRSNMRNRPIGIGVQVSRLTFNQIAQQSIWHVQPTTLVAE